MEQRNRRKKGKSKVEIAYLNSFLLPLLIKFLVWILIISAIWLLFAKQYINFKVEIVKNLAKLFYNGRAPYIHEVPLYQGLVTPLIPFIALVLTILNRKNFKTFLNKGRIFKIAISIVLLFIIEILGHFLEVVAIKSASPIPYFLVTILFSVGVVLFPFILWLFIMDGWPSGLRRGT